MRKNTKDEHLKMQNQVEVGWGQRTEEAGFSNVQTVFGYSPYCLKLFLKNGLIPTYCIFFTLEPGFSNIVLSPIGRHYCSQSAI